MKRHYIVCVRDDNLRLIGPFESIDRLSDWATKPTDNPLGSLVAANNPEDDPRWQSIELDDDDAGWPMGPSEFLVRVFAPNGGPMPD